MPATKKKKVVDPKLVGIWVVAVTKQQDLIKWGRYEDDDDTVYPYTDLKEAMKQAKYLANSRCHEDDRFYLLNIFNNGEVRTDELDDTEIRPATLEVEIRVAADQFQPVALALQEVVRPKFFVSVVGDTYRIKTAKHVVIGDLPEYRDLLKKKKSFTLKVKISRDFLTREAIERAMVELINEG